MLKDLQLKKTALEGVGIDMEVVYSRIEAIQIDIPWMAIFSESMRVRVRGLEIHLSKKSAN